MKEKTQEEIGKWFMDIAKYVATAALISSFLGEFSQKWVIYGSGFLLVALFFFLGVSTLNRNKNK